MKKAKSDSEYFRKQAGESQYKRKKQYLKITENSNLSIKGYSKSNKSEMETKSDSVPFTNSVFNKEKIDKFKPYPKLGFEKTLKLCQTDNQSGFTRKNSLKKFGKRVFGKV